MSEIKLPEACLIVSVRRGRRLRVAHGHTVLQGGDQVTIFADDRRHLPLLRKRLTGTAADEARPRVQRARHLEITLPAGIICSGKMVRELILPPNCILISIQRGSEVIIPHGDTVLRPGDVVEIFGVESELDQAQTYLLQE